jgi:hypothetical protein
LCTLVCARVCLCVCARVRVCVRVVRAHPAAVCINLKQRCPYDMQNERRAVIDCPSTDSPRAANFLSQIYHSFVKSSFFPISRLFHMYSSRTGVYCCPPFNHRCLYTAMESLKSQPQKEREFRCGWSLQTLDRGQKRRFATKCGS